MIDPTGKAMFTGEPEIALKTFVYLIGALSGLDHHDADGALVDSAMIVKFSPVNVSLIVADVDAVDVVAHGIAHLAQPMTQARATVMIEEHTAPCDGAGQ